jgi:hypothetical protein
LITTQRLILIICSDFDRVPQLDSEWRRMDSPSQG